MTDRFFSLFVVFDPRQTLYLLVIFDLRKLLTPQLCYKIYIDQSVSQNAPILHLQKN